MFSDWKFYVALYIFFTILFNQNYKICTNHMTSSASLTVLLEIIASVICIPLIPFFEFKFSNNISVYIFLFIAIIFYTLHNRLSTISRSGVESSTYIIIKQLPSVFMILIGILFFKEPFIPNKIIGAFLIIFSNVLVFYRKGILKIDRYVLLGIIANICMTIGMIIDVNYSNQFNLAIYVLFTIFTPAFIIFLIEHVKIKDLLLEYKYQNKSSLFITGICFSLMMIVKIKAYKLGNSSVVAPLSSLSVILSIMLGFLFLNERNNLLKKIISSILILIGVFLINL